MFITQEKVLKRIHQERQKGDLKKALARAVDGLERWPDDFNLSMEAIQLCFDTSDFKQSVTLMKNAMRRHPGSRAQILDYAREHLNQNFNPFLASFIIETLMRSRSIEEIRALLRRSSQEFKDSLIKRSETRSKGLKERGGTKNSISTDNELLLGLLYISSGQAHKASGPLGRVLASSPEDAEATGNMLIELERELPDDSDIKFTLGLASFMLSRPDKAEKRFFQCIQLESPPLDKLLKLLESVTSPSSNHSLLYGEIKIRKGEALEGAGEIRKYLAEEDAHQDKAASDRVGEYYPEQSGRYALAFDRLSALPERYHADPVTAFLVADTAVRTDHLKEAIEELRLLFRLHPESAPDIIEAIEGYDALRQSAPAQKLLMILNISCGDFDSASDAARLAAEMNPTQINTMIEIVDKRIKAMAEEDGAPDSKLTAVLAELHALSGNSEKAEEIMHDLESSGRIEKKELFRLTGKILDKCGATLDRVISSIEMGLRNGDVSGALPYALEFFRGNPNAHREFASRIEKLSDENEDNWKGISELSDMMSAEERLTRPLKILQAKAHMYKGEIEKAIFEFDQVIMFEESLRLDLIPVYEKAAEKQPGNTTLNLALYQLNLEEEFYTRSAHYLCKALESDPSQIRDVLPRFEKLVEKEPENGAIWVEILESSLAMNHLDLAREMLRRALAALPPESAAALNLFGARISSADGKSVDGLKCLATALTSGDADLKSIEVELMEIIKKEPRNPEARCLAGETLLRMGREEESMAQFEKCLDLSPEYLDRVREKLEQLLPVSVKPWLISRILGEISWMQERRPDAYRYFNNSQKGPHESLRGLSEMIEKLLADSPGDSRLTTIFARGLSLEGRFDESVSSLRELYSRDRNSVGRIMEILLEMLEADPAQFDANRLLAGIWVDSGEPVKSLQPLLRMMCCEEIDQKELALIVEEFLPIHQKDPSFLIPYASLKARSGDYASALGRFREAIETDRGSWSKALEEIKGIAWPADFDEGASILMVDCYIEGGWYDEAFAAIEKIAAPDDESRRQLINRIYMLTEKNPAAPYYLHGCSLLALSGEMDEAERLIRDGCEKLGAGSGINLLIALAEAMEGSGRAGDAARIFREILDDSEDRESIWKRIESAWLRWSGREIETGLKALDSESLSPARNEKLVRLALDRGDFRAALLLADGGKLPVRERTLLKAKTFLAMDRPAIALAVATRRQDGEGNEDGLAAELAYTIGLASEMLGDHGRAASAFSEAMGTDGGYRDSMQRAARNYGTMISIQIEDPVEVLEVTGNLDLEETKG